MRMMIRVSIPVESGNKGVQDGSLPKTIATFTEQFKPEAAYFMVENGSRTAYFFFDVADATLMPAIVEPFFIKHNAEIWFKPVMNAAELKVGLEKFGAKR